MSHADAATAAGLTVAESAVRGAAATSAQTWQATAKEEEPGERGLCLTCNGNAVSDGPLVLDAHTQDQELDSSFKLHMFAFSDSLDEHDERHSRCSHRKPSRRRRQALQQQVNYP